MGYFRSSNSRNNVKDKTDGGSSNAELSDLISKEGASNAGGQAVDSRVYSATSNATGSPKQSAGGGSEQVSDYNGPYEQ